MSILHRSRLYDGAKIGDLRRVLHRQIAHTEAGRSPATVHASDLTHETKPFCARYRAFASFLPLPERYEFLSTAQTVTFHIGRVLQDAVVHWLADAGVAVGDWECLACGWFGRFRKRPPICKKCPCRTFRPVECRFVSALSGVSCGIDAIVDFGGPKLRAVEIKTIDKEVFKGLQAPLAEHRQRTNLYLRVISEDPSARARQIDTERATILYVSKGGWGVKDEAVTRWGFRDAPYSPFVEFTIHRNDAALEAVLLPAQKLQKFHASGEMPEGICASSVEQQARYCPFSTDCFSGRYPAGRPVDGGV